MEGGLKPHTSSLKPVLTEQNKYSQLLFALEMGNLNDPTKFQDMYNMVHVNVDKKWFLMRDKQCFLLVDDAQHCVCHKGHMTKVMFLCAVACQCYKKT